MKGGHTLFVVMSSFRTVDLIAVGVWIDLNSEC